MSLATLLSASWIVSFALVFLGLGNQRFLSQFGVGLPIVGLARFVLLSQIVSVISNATLFVSSILALVALSLYSSLKLRELTSRDAKKLLSVALTLSLAASSFVAIRHLGESPFGTYNFDFIYGVQDGLFLSDNSVRIPPAQGGAFPFDWGSVQIGRYCGIFLVTLLSEVTGSPLVAGAITYAVFVALAFLGYLFFCQVVLSLSTIKSFAISLAAILSPLSLMGLQNQLIGQTSGIPIVLIVLAILIAPPQRFDLGDLGLQVNLGMLVAGLFWIYPAQLLLLAPLFVAYVIRIIAISKERGARSRIIRGVAITALLSALSVSRDLTGTLGRIRALVFYSEGQIESAGSDLYNSIFNQFSSARGPAIASGLRIYGDSTPLWPIFSAYFLVAVGALIYIFYKVLIDNFRAGKPESEFLQILFSLYVGSAFVVFFLTQQNYLLFKLTTWFTPVLLIIAIGFVSNFLRFSTSPRLVFLLLIPGLALNLLTSFEISDRAMRGNDIPFTQSRLAFDEELNLNISNRDVPPLIYMPSMEEAAWITLNVRNETVREAIDFFGFDQQSLYLGFNRRLPELPKLDKDTVIYFPKENKDIFPSVLLSGSPEWENANMLASKVSSIKLAFAFGTGAFYADRVEQSPFGSDINFRWSNGYLSFGVYSNAERSISLRIPVLLGPDFSGEFRPEVNNGDIRNVQTGINRFEVTIEDMKLSPGWNQIEMMANNRPIKPVPRNSMRPDFRPLTIAIGTMMLTEL